MPARTRTRAALVRLAAVAALSLALAGCASAPEPVEVPADAVVIDVRTAAEHAQGHLAGATLLDVSNGDLEAAIPSLDPDAATFVYCRSGSRSASAAALLREAGFTDVTDLGSLDEAAAATGIAIER